MKRAVLTVVAAIALHFPAYADVYRENWENRDIGIANAYQGYACSADQNLIDPPCNIPQNEKYGTFTNVDPTCMGSGQNTCYDVDTSTSPHTLIFHGETTSQYFGLPLLSRERFDNSDYISVEANIRAYCGLRLLGGPISNEADCFAGLTLFNGEGNYREIAYRNSSLSGSTMEIRMVSNCDDHTLINASTGSPLTVGRNSQHTLRLDYYGHVPGGKWVFFVDGIAQWLSVENGSGIATEPPYARTQCPPGKVDVLQLQNPARYGLYLLGWDMVGGFSEGAVGPVSVYTKRYLDQSQTTQSDGIGLSNTTWVAQRVQMGNGHPNTTMAQLFLIQGNQYKIEAYTDNNGQIDNLINSTSYKADVDGLQYVPLWVPSSFANYWIIVKGVTPNAPIGTTTNGSQPYNGTFLYSANAGQNWTPLPRNLTFATYSRQ